MLYPGDDKWHMSIDTIVTDEADEDAAFELIHEFLYLYGWSNRCYFHFLNASAATANHNTLLERKSPFFQSPRRYMPWSKRFTTMADPEASDDFIKAISLYNDAKYSNDIYITSSFVCSKLLIFRLEDAQETLLIG